ncbi:hypothetical protein MBLNU230_g5439t1 [Neophaeotheca triangularis]
MMTQSYFANGEFDPFHQANHRVLPNHHHSNYERSLPYDYYDGHRSSYPDHGSRPTRIPINHPQGNNDSAQERKRISVACSRCRRRKIKCSGELKDGPGCQACRASGADVSQCSFIRVGSFTPAGADAVHPIQSREGAGTTYSSSYPDASSASNYNQTLYHRPSIPTLQTRSAYATDYDSQYENSPVDGYSYSTGRQDSFTGSYGQPENYRSWTAAAPVPASVSNGTYYEPHYVYNYGNVNMQSPAYSQSRNSRLPSVTSDNNYSSLNMSVLQSCLPPADRQLPKPCPQYQTQPTYPVTEVPVIPPIAAPRPHINGIHSRTAIPWSTDSNPSLVRQSSRNSLAALGGIMTTTSAPSTTNPVTESAFGYQFAPNTLLPPQPNSPVSPSSGPGAPNNSPPYHTSSAPETFGTLSMRPPTCCTPRLQPDLIEERPLSSSHDPAASLYSFSTDNTHETRAAQQTPAGSRRPSQQQPQHVSSLDSLRRQASFEQQQHQQQRGAGHRISVSNLNSQY